MPEFNGPKCSKELKEENLEQVTGGALYYYHHDIGDAIPNFTGVCCNKNLTYVRFDYDKFLGNCKGFDAFKCDECGKEYRRYWEGSFWTINDYYFTN